MGEHSKRRSSIESELPENIRKELRRRLVEDNETYDDITAWLNAEGYDISRSAVGRYGKTFFDIVKDMKVIEEQSATLVGDEASSMVLEEATTKLILNKLMQMLMTDDVDLKKSTRIMTDLANLQKSNVSREKLKIEIRDRAKAVAEKVAGIAKKKGLTPDTVARIKKEILGISK
ncbi:MAG: phage protein Gp27 family protein [Deferribacterales bacterium]